MDLVGLRVFLGAMGEKGYMVEIGGGAGVFGVHEGLLVGMVFGRFLWFCWICIIKVFFVLFVDSV